MGGGYDVPDVRKLVMRVFSVVVELILSTVVCKGVCVCFGVRVRLCFLRPR